MKVTWPRKLMITGDQLIVTNMDGTQCSSYALEFVTGVTP